MPTTSSRAALAAALAAVVAGCGGADDGRPKVYPAAVRVTHKGEPMAGAVVALHPLADPAGKAPRAHGTADADGKAALTTYATGDGAPAGEYAVTVVWPGGKAGPPKNAADDADPPPDRLKGAFANPKTTKVRATVREQPNAIDLTLP